MNRLEQAAMNRLCARAAGLASLLLASMACPPGELWQAANVTPREILQTLQDSAALYIYMCTHIYAAQPGIDAGGCV